VKLVRPHVDLPRLRPYLPALAASALLGAVCVRAILGAAGEPAAPLDDAFIHLQFARRLAEGHFFSYVDGEGYSSGATSLLWPILLAPFHALGLRGVSLLWATWLLGTAAHAGLAVEAYRLSLRLAGRAAALGVAAMCMLFGAFAWFAWSGMETIALAWLLLRGARVAGAWCEPGEGSASAPPPLGEVLAVGIAAPLVRPEGVVASIAIAVALALHPRGRSRRRLFALAPLAGALVAPAINLVLAGHAASATAQVKWMPASPYYDVSAVLAATAQNARLLVTNLMNGGDWTVLFLPEGASYAFLLGAVALPIAAYRRRAAHHGLFVLLVAAGAFIPCTYSSFLWNRIRYVWPFVGAWFVMLGCLARELGDLARVLYPRLVAVTPLVAGAFAGALGIRLPWAIHDLAQSASAITRQQVALGRWAAETLPPDARIGVNDTGAIAYLSGRRTFDVVGLTTEGEARYWVLGAGSRFEHYEKLPRARLPTHFIVYPQWMACPPVLGEKLTEATVVDQSILGGVTMVAYEARWDLLGSGALPRTPPAGLALADELDVADLESEHAHAYDLTGAWDQDDQVAVEGDDGAPGQKPVADGGRMNRARDRFRVSLPGGRAVRLVMRVGGEVPVDLAVRAGGRAVGVVPVTTEDAWEEPSIDLPADLGGQVEIDVEARERDDTPPGKARFSSFHYWLYAAP
jgi:hypothetical protein